MMLRAAGNCESSAQMKMKFTVLLTLALLTVSTFGQNAATANTPTIWLRWDSVISAASYRIYELTPTNSILLTETTNLFFCIGDPALPTNEVKNPEPARGFYWRNANEQTGFFRVASAINVTTRRAFVLYHVNPEGGESAPAGEISFPFTVLTVPFGPWRLKGGENVQNMEIGRAIHGTIRVALFVDPQRPQGFLTYTNDL
jgi:hypothetical protein